MTIELLDYQLIALLIAAWASGCVTIYVIEERRHRSERRFDKHVEDSLSIFKED